MSRPRKTLYQLTIRDRTFLARRHAHLLEKEPLLPHPRLRELQQAFRAEVSRLERAAIARQLERAVRETDQDMMDEIFRNLPLVVVPHPGPRPKTLTERVLDGSFRPRYHDHLLEQDALEAACPIRGSRNAEVWQRLQRLQQLYRLAIDFSGDDKKAAKLRRGLADEFAALAHDLPAAPRA